MRTILIILFLICTACSESDKGVNYSDNYKEQEQRNRNSKVSTKCAFPDVVLAPTTDGYSTNTENLITSVLSKYVSPLQSLNSFDFSGLVNYSDWLSSTDDKKILCQVIQHFANTDMSTFSREQKMAFYINAYNVFTLELILKNYVNIDKGESRDVGTFPYRKSIRYISGLGDDVWNVFRWKVGSKNLTLNQIEKEILIPMGDARIHFAVNCASLGCPPLRNEAFTEADLDMQLDEMSTFFVSSPAYNSIELLDAVYDPVDGENYYEISSIFEWYASDFINDTSGRYGSIQKFIVHHLDRTDAELGFPKVDLLDLDIWIEEFSSYSWALNEEGS